MDFFMRKFIMLLHKNLMFSFIYLMFFPTVCDNTILDLSFYDGLPFFTCSILKQCFNFFW